MSVKIDINILQSSLIIHKCFWSSITGPMPYSLCDFHWEMLYKHALLFFFFSKPHYFKLCYAWCVSAHEHVCLCTCMWYTYMRMLVHYFPVLIEVFACNFWFPCRWPWPDLTFGQMCAKYIICQKRQLGDSSATCWKRPSIILMCHKMQRI